MLSVGVHRENDKLWLLISEQYMANVCKTGLFGRIS